MIILNKDIKKLKKLRIIEKIISKKIKIAAFFSPKDLLSI